VAVITGAGRGIGRGMAQLMAAEGAAVVVNDLGVTVDGQGQDTSAADATVAAIQAAGGTAVASYDSVADFRAAERIVDLAVQRFGRIDILVNNAGILRDRMLFNMSEDDFDSVIAVHLKGTFNCSRHASVHMRQQKAGRIISMSSTSGLYGNTGQANYGAAKDGIAGFTRVVSRGPRPLRHHGERDRPRGGDAHDRHGRRCRPPGAGARRRGEHGRRGAQSVAATTARGG
jgi:NAD(P)-dependent dehydrogenase (short-subunit alcohol dehydrogenase family)